MKLILRRVLIREIGMVVAALIALALTALAQPVWAQTGNAPVPAVSSGSGQEDDRMMTPPPVSGEAYSAGYSTEARSNYLRGGLTFDTAYSDNVLTGLGGTPVSDISYSIWPTIAIDQTRPRLHWSLTYAPGFTFYQRNSGRDEADHNVAVLLRYRLSPHVTLSLNDSFQKSSNVFNQPDQMGTTSGSVGGLDTNVVAPVADRLTNSGSAEITYQFALNSMVGASGTFTNLHYPNPAEVDTTNPDAFSGIYDAAARIGSAFYSQRFGRRHYFGATYQYQQLLSYPTGIAGGTETDTQAVLAFYTFYPTAGFSLSFFGGPQYSSTQQIALPTVNAWYPAAGASLGWQGRRTSAALGFSHTITGGGGLIGAAQADSGSVSLRQMLTKRLNASLGGQYSNRSILTVSTLPTSGGHTISGTVSLQQQVSEHLSVRAGYTRMRQVYQSLAVLSPDTNREWISISYTFERPLGR